MTPAQNIVALPCNASARRERQLAAAWSAEDLAAEQLRAARAKSRALEREVSRDRGFVFPQSREVLARPGRA